MLKTPPPARHIHPQSTGPTGRATVGGVSGVSVASGTFSDTGPDRLGSVGLGVFYVNVFNDSLTLC